MSDQEIIFSIADHFGFERDFMVADPEESSSPYYDAECEPIPDYIEILGRVKAEALLYALNELRNGISLYRQSHS